MLNHVPDPVIIGRSKRFCDWNILFINDEKDRFFKMLSQHGAYEIQCLFRIGLIPVSLPDRVKERFAHITDFPAVQKKSVRLV